MAFPIYFILFRKHFYWSSSRIRPIFEQITIKSLVRISRNIFFFNNNPLQKHLKFFLTDSYQVMSNLFPSHNTSPKYYSPNTCLKITRTWRMSMTSLFIYLFFRWIWCMLFDIVNINNLIRILNFKITWKMKMPLFFYTFVSIKNILCMKFYFRS